MHIPVNHRILQIPPINYSSNSSRFRSNSSNNSTNSNFRHSSISNYNRRRIYHSSSINSSNIILNSMLQPIFFSKSKIPRASPSLIRSNKCTTTTAKEDPINKCNSIKSNKVTLRSRSCNPQVLFPIILDKFRIRSVWKKTLKSS